MSRNGPADLGLHASPPHEGEVRPQPSRGEPDRRLHDDTMAFHDAQPAHQADEGRGVAGAQGRADGRRRGAGSVGVDVGAAGERHDILRSEQPGRDVLPTDGVRHGERERGRATVEPAVGGVRSDGLSDVSRSHEGTRTAAQAVGDRGQPVFLAAMDVDDVGVGEPPTELANVGRVGDGADASGEAEGDDPLHADLPRALDDLRLRSRPAPERHRVAAAGQLLRHARSPVRIRRPAAARQQVQDPHARLR